MGVWNILGKQLHFSNRRQQRSKQSNQSGLGIVLQDTNKNWHQDRTSHNTDCAYSTWWSRRCWATPLAVGHNQKNTKEWYDQHNAKFFASSSKQIENTKRKLRPAGTRKLKKTQKQTTEAQMKKLQRVPVQTQITTKRVTLLPWKTPMKRLTQAKLKKKIRLNT